VLAADLNGDGAEELARSAEEGLSILGLRLDVTVEAEWEAAVARVLEPWGVSTPWW
jgi:NAD(P)-dependent dehydrogenase (short-subunit alcohol dehydrogenase family)